MNTIIFWPNIVSNDHCLQSCIPFWVYLAFIHAFWQIPSLSRSFCHSVWNVSYLQDFLTNLEHVFFVVSEFDSLWFGVRGYLSWKEHFSFFRTMFHLFQFLHSSSFPSVGVQLDPWSLNTLNFFIPNMLDQYKQLYFSNTLNTGSQSASLCYVSALHAGEAASQ